MYLSFDLFKILNTCNYIYFIVTFSDEKMKTFMQIKNIYLTKAIFFQNICKFSTRNLNDFFFHKKKHQKTHPIKKLILESSIKKISSRYPLYLEFYRNITWKISENFQTFFLQDLNRYSLVKIFYLPFCTETNCINESLVERIEQTPSDEKKCIQSLSLSLSISRGISSRRVSPLFLPSLSLLLTDPRSILLSLCRHPLLLLHLLFIPCSFIRTRERMRPALGLITPSKGTRGELRLRNSVRPDFWDSFAARNTS